MQVNLVGHHLEITQTIQHYVQQKLAALTHFLGQIKSVHFQLALDQGKHKADALLQINDEELHITAEHTDLYSAIDLLFDNIKTNKQDQLVQKN